MSSVRFPIEAGHVMLFARALGDQNPIYFDEAYAAKTEIGHTITPPTFPVANVQFDPDYATRPQPGKQWHGSGRDPSGGPPPTAGFGMHVEEHLTYHRHLRPGDVLQVTARFGSEWEKDGKSGKLKFRERLLEYRDAAGELVISERRVNVVISPADKS